MVQGLNDFSLSGCSPLSLVLRFARNGTLRGSQCPNSRTN